MSNFDPIGFLILAFVFAVIAYMVWMIGYIVIMNLFFPRKLRLKELNKRRNLVSKIRDSVLKEDWDTIMTKLKSYRDRTGQRMSDIKYSVENGAGRGIYRLRVKDFYLDIVYDANGTPDYTVWDSYPNRILERKKLNYNAVKRPFDGCVGSSFDCDMSGGI